MPDQTQEQRVDALTKDAENGDIPIPGQWKCHKCGYQLSSNILYVANMGVGPNRKEPEPCPNDGEPMFPVTWMERLSEHSDRILDEIKLNRALTKERDTFKCDFDEEVKIVNRIWALLGSPSYEELKGRSIYDLIDTLKRERDEARAAHAELPEGIKKSCDAAKLEEALWWSYQDPSLPLRYHRVDCDCAAHQRIAKYRQKASQIAE